MLADRVSVEKRSYIMSRIRSKNTKPELVVFRFLRAEHVYFKKHYDRIKGKPDIALPRKKKAVFIDGDFWHGKVLETRGDRLSEYWIGRLRRNMERDRVRRSEMTNAGWQIFQVWESDLMKSPKEFLPKIKHFLLS